jgi:hypothetical protein
LWFMIQPCSSSSSSGSAGRNSNFFPRKELRR